MRESLPPDLPDVHPQRRREWSGLMRSIVIPLFVAGAVLALVAARALGTGLVSSSGGGLEVGGEAPSFTIRSLDGADVSPASFKGRPVVLNFWASWCEPCRTEVPALADAAVAHEGDGLAVLAVNVREDEGTVRAFAEAYGLAFPLLLDRDGSVYRKYRLTGIPSTFFIGRDGELEAVALGPLDLVTLEQQLGTILD